MDLALILKSKHYFNNPKSDIDDIIKKTSDNDKYKLLYIYWMLAHDKLQMMYVNKTFNIIDVKGTYMHTEITSEDMKIYINRYYEKFIQLHKKIAEYDNTIDSNIIFNIMRDIDKCVFELFYELDYKIEQSGLSRLNYLKHIIPLGTNDPKDNLFNYYYDIMIKKIGNIIIITKKYSALYI